MTRVTVGVPVYNGERYLREALSTLVGQTHQDLEIIISDNASTDRTPQICEEFARADSRVRYFRQEVNRGGAFNHNFVAEQATAPYVKWYAADDWLEPDCIETCAKALDDDPDAVLAWTRPATHYDDRETEVEYGDEPVWVDDSPSARLASLLGPPPSESLISWCYPIYGVARTEVFRACLPLGSFYGADNVVLVGLALRGRWARVDDGLLHCRRHPASSTAGRDRFQVALWMNPRTTPGRSMPETRRFVGYLKAVWTAPLGIRERVRCFRIAVWWPATYDHAGFMWWDVKTLAREVVATRGRNLRPARVRGT